VAVTGANTTYGMEAQDLNGDARPEIILNQFNGNDIYILKNGSSVGQISFPDIVKVPVTGSLNHLTTADFNEDGKLDIAVTSSANDNKAFVLLNQSTGTISFAPPITLTGGDWPWGIDASDIDGDKDVDIIIGNINNNSVTNEIVVYRNNGNNAALAFTRESIQKGKRSRNLRVGDLDGDGKPDIAYTTVTSNSVDILRNKNCFTPVIITETPLTICAGQTITLRSVPSPGTTFAWKESGTPAFKTSTDPFADITTVGTYTVTATSEGGSCVVESAAIIVTSSLGTVPANPTIDPVTPICSGQTLQLSTPTVAGATYEWKGPNSFSSTDQNPTRLNMTAADAGIYTLQLQVAGGTCKTNIATVRADLANLENFFVSSSVASNTVCQGSSLNLIVNQLSGHTFQWITGQTSPTLIVNQEGVYNVRVTNTTLGCSNTTNTVAVKVFTMPVSAFTPSTVSTCVDKSVSFTNQSTFDNRGTVAYSWDFGDATTSLLESPSKTYTTAATRNVQLTVSYTGVAGCSNTSAPKSIVVAAPKIPVITASVNPICAGEASVLSVTGTFATYSWTGSATGSASTLNIEQPGTYVVNTAETNSCTSTAQIIITAKPLLTLEVSVNDEPVTAGEDVIVFASIPVQLLASGADSYSWSPTEGLDNPSVANPKATPLVETSYMVTGSKTGSCDGTFTLNIKFDPAGTSFQPPNVFSPNGDPFNELWVVPGVQNFSDCTLSIFNKQGSKVFEQKGYTNNWDGNFEGKQLPEGTYYYVLTCPDKQPETGHVLLAR
jgi:gliding motility-associated-like protein